MQAKITAHVKLDQKCTITAKVSDDVTKDRALKVAEMQTAVNELLKVYTPSKGAEDTGHNKHSLNVPEKKPISTKQVGLIKFLLGQKGVNVKSFCRQHTIDRLEEMSMEEARTAIQDLKTTAMFDEE